MNYFHNTKSVTAERKSESVYRSVSSQFYNSRDMAQTVSLRYMTSEISVLLDSEHLRILVEKVAQVMVFLRIYLFNNFSRAIA